MMQMIYYFFVFVLSYGVYCITNAALIASLFVGVFRMNRWSIFFKQACAWTFVSIIGYALGAILLFQIGCSLFGGCSTFYVLHALLVPSYPSLLLSMLGTLTIQRYIIQDEFALSESKMITLLIVSNAGASLVRYATLIALGELPRLIG